MTDNTVIAAVHEGPHGQVGQLTLHAPATLNSLTLEMVDALQMHLLQWRHDPAIKAVFIDGSGDKAFCAGGDVQALHRSASAKPGGPCDYAETFFAREYRMNYTLHTYPKPLIAWGHGIVMGGGLGVLAGCSHRIVTERTRSAMPEVTIALFPDVGGSFFLNRMPGACGLFLALTGASINAADCLYTGLADRFIEHSYKEAVLAALSAANWCETEQENHAVTHSLLRSFATTSLEALPSGQVEPHRGVIDRVCDGDDIHTVIDQICALETDDTWLLKARDGLRHGSPLAALWIARQLQETRHASLREVFQSELQLATNVVRYPEFAEGVRALLIDKDRQPRWAYANSRAVPADLLDSFFAAPWPENPLIDLP
jgi:enoyl-CoA hydratase/carnithine racemase